MSAAEQPPCPRSDTPSRLEPAGLEPLALDALGLDPPGLDPPGLNPPGLNPPGLNPPGLNPPGLNPPGLNPPGLDPLGLDPPGLDPLGLDPLSEEAVDTAVFAWEWARALAGTSWVAADRTVIAEQLRGLTRRLVAATQAQPFSPAAGTDVGRGVVEIGFDTPEALARTVTLLALRFLPELHPERLEEYRQRLGELLGMVSLGFVRAVRDKTLQEQEAIRSSALLAGQRALAEQRETALRDPLTRQLNREGFAARLTELLREHRTGVLGVCLFALDGFDALDRGLGRDVGDQLLEVASGRLSATVGGSHEIVARVGRGEFIVAGIDGGTDRGVKDAAARRLALTQRELREPIDVDGRQVVLSASVGLLARPVEQVDPEQVLRDADLAASWATLRGPGGLAMFEISRARRQVSDLALTADLPSAIEHSRLLPHYQPIVSVGTGEVEVVEALARWPHEDHGMLTPDRFLHLAERGGLITVLGRAVLAQACRQARHWQDTLAHPPVVAVNVAAIQLGDPQIVRDVVTVLEETGLAAAHLELEITEHAALEDPTTLRIIRDLAGVGVNLAIDDFGTGLAHLAQLPDLPAAGVTTLKVPSEFLRPLRRPVPVGPPADSASDPAEFDTARVRVLTAIIELAHDLGLRVTVEGVETRAQDELIRDLGADLAQGNYYAWPDTATEITRMLA